MAAVVVAVVVVALLALRRRRRLWRCLVLGWCLVLFLLLLLGVGLVVGWCVLAVVVVVVAVLAAWVSRRPRSLCRGHLLLPSHAHLL